MNELSADFELNAQKFGRLLEQEIGPEIFKSIFCECEFTKVTCEDIWGEDKIISVEVRNKKLLCERYEIAESFWNWGKKTISIRKEHNQLNQYNERHRTQLLPLNGPTYNSDCLGVSKDFFEFLERNLRRR